MKTSDFYYDLPQELIAQTPIEKRDTSRLMTLDRVSGATGHHHFYDLPDYLNPGDCLILNNSRVLPARLVGQRLPGGGICEVLLLIDRGDKVWECLVRPGRKLRQGHQTVLRQRGADRRDRGAAGGAAAAWSASTTRASFWRRWSGWARCLCPPTSRRSSRTRSGIRPCTPRSWAAPPPPRRGSTSPRSCWRRSGPRA